jgi:hypothetical protein
MPLIRTMEPELLDAMDANDPRAVRARDDLDRVNRMMGHLVIWDLVLRNARVVPRPPATLTNIGSGDGRLMLALARKLAPRWRTLTLYLVDRQPAVSDTTLAGFAGLGWEARVVRADAEDWVRDMPPSGVVLANLFLHHLDESGLRRLFAWLAEGATLVAACEPRRSRLALSASRLLGLAGCGPVARSDAVAGVRAGFSGLELSRLWPRSREWRLHEARVGLFTHFFLARRRSPGAE